MNKNLILYVLFFLSVAFIQVDNAYSTAAYHSLVIGDLKKYEVVKYGDLQKDPKKYFNVEKVVIDLEYVGEMGDLSPFEKAFPGKLYYYLRIPSVGGEDSYDYNNNSYRGGSLIPFLVSRSKRSSCVDYVSKLGKKTPIKIYGNLKAIPRAKDLSQKYYFIIEDIYTVEEYEAKPEKKEEVKVAEAVKETPPEETEKTDKDKIEKKPEPKEPAEEEEDVQEVNPKNLDLLSKKYEGKKIRFSSVYKGRKKEISYLSSKFPANKFFELEGIDEVKLPKFSVIVEINEANIQKFLNLEDGQEMEISGILQKIEKNGDVIYYILE